MSLNDNPPTWPFRRDAFEIELVRKHLAEGADVRCPWCMNTDTRLFEMNGDLYAICGDTYNCAWQGSVSEEACHYNPNPITWVIA